jgi:hypothetical protein
VTGVGVVELRARIAVKRIVEGQLIVRRALELVRPSQKRVVRDLERTDRQIGVALGKSVPKFTDRRIKEAQDDPRTHLASGGAANVPLLFRPDPPVDNDVAAKLQGTQRDRPLQALDPASAWAQLRFRRGNARIESVQPLVAREPKRGRSCSSLLARVVFPEPGSPHER